MSDLLHFTVEKATESRSSRVGGATWVEVVCEMPRSQSPAKIRGRLILDGPMEAMELFGAVGEPLTLRVVVVREVEAREAG